MKLIKDLNVFVFKLLSEVDRLASSQYWKLFLQYLSSVSYISSSWMRGTKKKLIFYNFTLVKSS